MSEQSGSRVLASVPSVGRVTQCDRGCVHVSIGNVTVKLTAHELRQVSELLVESQGSLRMDDDGSEVH